jgi:hypothetical protein
MRSGFAANGLVIRAAALAFSVTLAGASLAAAEPGPAHIIPLFPRKEVDLKNGLPPGMTAATFQAGHGTAALRMLDDGRVEIAFESEGLIPYGVYTLWNVLETDPFKDEPLGEFGAGRHSVADGAGHVERVVVLDDWPGKELLLDYHAICSTWRDG